MAAPRRTERAAEEAPSPANTSPALQEIRQQQFESLADFLKAFSTLPAPKLLVERTWPKTHLGHVISGQCHDGFIDYIDDAEELRTLVRKQFGGNKFEVKVYLTGVNGKPKYQGSFPMENDAAPLRNGKPIEPMEAAIEAVAGRSTERELARRQMDRMDRLDREREQGGSGGDARTERMIDVVDNAANARAKSAEDAARREVDLLRTQLDGVQIELRAARHGSGTNMSDLGALVDKVAARSTSADAAINSTIAELRRDLDGARESMTRERDSHRGEIQTIRDANRGEVQALRDANWKETIALRDEHRKELDAARKDARESTDREVTRLREDAKMQLEHQRVMYETQTKTVQLEVDRLRHDLSEARKAAISPDKAIENALGMYERLDERIGRNKDDDDSTMNKVIGALSDPNVSQMIPGTLGMLGAMLTGKPMVIQGPPQAMAPAQQQAQGPQPQQQLRGRAPFRRHVTAMPGEAQMPAQASQPNPGTVPLPADLMQFAPMLAQLETALGADTNPDNFARGMVSSADNTVLQAIAVQDPIAIVEYLDRAGVNTVLTTRRGKQYLVAVIESLRRHLTAPALAPAPAPAPIDMGETSGVSLDEVLGPPT